MTKRAAMAYKVKTFQKPFSLEPKGKRFLAFIFSIVDVGSTTIFLTIDYMLV